MSVVLIEDGAELASVILRALTREGMHVEHAFDAEAGLELVRRHEPDTVILDVTLPGMDGVEACRQLRTFSDAYVIMLTARDSEADRLVGLAVGADDYMTEARRAGRARRPSARRAGGSTRRT